MKQKLYICIAWSFIYFAYGINNIHLKGVVLYAQGTFVHIDFVFLLLYLSNSYSFSTNHIYQDYKYQDSYYRK